MASFVLPRPQLISCKNVVGSKKNSRSPVRRKHIAVKRHEFRPKLVSSSSCSSPWLMLPPSLDGTNMVYDFYSLAEDKVVSFNKKSESESESESPDDEATFVGMSHGWLICYNLNEVDEGDGNLFLSNPLSRRHIKLPSALSLPYSGDPMHVENVIISSSDPDNPNCRALMIYGPSRRLALCCPARQGSNWTPFGKQRYCSSVYSTRQRLFFCATEKKDDTGIDIGIGIEAWDLNRLGSPISIPMEDVSLNEYPLYCSSERERDAKFLFHRTTFLAIADKSNDLYLVRRFTVMRIGPDGSHVKIMKFGDLPVKEVFPYQTTDFDVYKYDKEAQDWKYMDCFLDGMALFIGKNHGFVLSVADYPGLKPDAIYFTDVKKNPFYQAIGGGHDIGIFDYRNKTISPCYYSCLHQSIKKIFPPPLWFTPRWPDHH